jgi:phage terminase large subunit
MTDTPGELSIGYKVRPQFYDFHLRKQRWAVIVAHRRAGKTVACVMDLIDSALRNKRQRPPPSYAYVAPLYRQAKQVSWQYLKEYGLMIPGAEASESELKVTFPNGSIVRLYGADNPDSLRGIYLDGVILDEAADMSPRINEVLRPTLSDYKGWCCWIGTPRGMNDFYDLVHGTPNWCGAKDDPDWFFRMFRASETGILDPEELASAKRQLTPEQYLQEYECSFEAAILGAYYGREMELAEAEKRIAPHIYDPSLSVCTAWDLGHSNATAIWFYQQGGFEVRIIDYYAASNMGLDHFVAMLTDKSARPGNVKGYKYDKHYLPHDVAQKRLVSGTHNTQLAMLRAMGMQNVIPVPKLSIDDGIEAVRKLLPRCWFDREKCTEGLKALRQYHREWDDSRKVFIERPYHDWASDPADAFRYLALGLRPTVTEKKDDGPRRRKPTKGWIY